MQSQRRSEIFNQQPHTFLSCVLLSKTQVCRKNMQNLHVHKKSHIACFGKKWKTYTNIASLRTYSKKTTFWTFRCPKMCFGAWECFGVSKNSSIYLPFCEFSIILVWSVIKVDRIYVINKMALAVFHKQLYKKPKYV